ncbi:adaptor protein MecA [Enterococcus italicus]|uniref:adaptor protein MecA n=1 Tax=Enterococcus italicus TaxID=246144 RepID=UPI002073D9C2|nr:adaptor protein MecA [Enterococcus italicus]MCM6881883.1 adaptor protein MecA [Enterococcus italicus]
MEMEHINENTIRVLIKGEDLAARGFTFLDLLGNKDEIESFFYSILEEVDVNEEFKGSEAVTFQVMPKGDGLELFISKSNAEELNESFKAFRDEDGELPEWFGKMDDESDFEEVGLEELEQELAAQKEDADKKPTHPVLLPKQSLIIEIANFEMVVWLAHEVQLEEVDTTLYAMNQQYYLAIQFLGEDVLEAEKKNILAHVSEFGRKSTITKAVLDEHGQVIVKNDALPFIREQFAL